MMGHSGGRRRMLAWGAALAVLAAWPAANAAQSVGPAQWTLAVTEEVTSVEPGTAPSANATALVLRHLFEPLAAYEGTPFKLTPRLASSWTVKDNRVWEFKLRPGVRHHDGTPVTAEDVKYSLDIYRQDGSARKANTVGITNVEVVDPQTVRITTDGPRPGLMANLSLLLIFPKKAREKMGADEFGKKPVATAPTSSWSSCAASGWCWRPIPTITAGGCSLADWSCGRLPTQPPAWRS